VPFLWQFHKVHHMAEQLDASTGLRMHAADFLQLSALPILLFGLLLDTSGWPAWIIIAVMGVGQVMDGFSHANTLMPEGPFFRAWNLLFNSPNFHAWHHTRNGHIIDGNYSNTLIIWDRLFGTDVSHGRPPELYGVIEDRTLGNDLLSWWLLRPRLRPQT
jgi:lathosterol oxidase